MKIHCAICLLCLSLPGLSEARTTQRVVYGQVTDVQPVEEDYQTSVCVSADPETKPASAGLSELLTWDLQPHCRQSSQTRVTAYRVKYRWDGRSYTQVMKKDPGERVPLLLKLR